MADTWLVSFCIKFTSALSIMFYVCPGSISKNSNTSAVWARLKNWKCHWVANTQIRLFNLHHNLFDSFYKMVKEKVLQSYCKWSDKRNDIMPSVPMSLS